VCHSLITFNQLVDFHEIQQGCYAIKGDIDAIISDLVALTVKKWRTFKLLRWMQNLHQSKWEHEGLGLVTMETRPFLCDTERKLVQQWISPNVVVERLTLLFRISEVLGSNFGAETEYRDWVFCSFPQSLQTNAMTVPSIRP
jgi:hypothetical protein